MSITTQTLSYTAADGTVLQSYLCLPEQPAAALSGVLVAPEWWGMSEHAKQAAKRLAEAGYAAMVMDLYGEGRLTDDAGQAGEWMNAALADPAILAERTDLAQQALAAEPQVQAQNLAAIGFCFGGKVVLDMARRGADLKAVVSFHGFLATPTPAVPGMVKAELLVQHAGLDSMVAMSEVDAFKAEMQAAGVRFHVDVFADARHGFTNPQATHNGEKNGVDIGYDAAAAATAWQNMLNLLERTI